MSSGQPRASGLLLPVEIRADVSASPAVPADEQRFDVGKPDIIRPSVAADRDGVAAPIIGAIDQQTANAGGAHLAKKVTQGHLAEISARLSTTCKSCHRSAECTTCGYRYRSSLGDDHS